MRNRERTHDSGRCRRRSPRDRTRGQLILIGVVTMGMLLVGMTLVMNGFLYAQNVESEGVPAAVGDIESTQQTVYTEYGELLVRSNEHDSDPRSRFPAVADEVRTAIRTQEAAAQGRLVDVSLVSGSQKDGVLFRQTDGGDFTDESGTEWDVTASDVRRFQLAVNQSALANVDSITEEELESAFHVVVADESGNEWTLYIATEDGSDTVVAVDDESGPTKRYDAGDSVDSLTVDLVTGSVNEAGTETVDETDLYDGEYASNLDDSSTYDIKFKNPDTVEGAYALTVPDDGHLAKDDSLSEGKDAVYASRFELTYESADNYYSGEIRIAPCGQSATRCLTYIRATGGS